MSHSENTNVADVMLKNEMTYITCITQQKNSTEHMASTQGPDMTPTGEPKTNLKQETKTKFRLCLPAGSTHQNTFQA
jgi:hypothetical protein